MVSYGFKPVCIREKTLGDWCQRPFHTSLIAITIINGLSRWVKSPLWGQTCYDYVSYAVISSLRSDVASLICLQYTVLTKYKTALLFLTRPSSSYIHSAFQISINGT